VNGGTRVEIVTEVRLQGVVAQYGRGVIGDVAARMTEQFAACVQRKLAG
jgi:carbon monoxide dehydrogenase subunit G